MLVGVICGNCYDEYWNLVKEIVDFYDLKGDLEVVLDLIGKLGDIQFKVEMNLVLYLGQFVVIYLKDECIGFIGVVYFELECKLDLNGCMLVFELEWNKFVDCIVLQVWEILCFLVNCCDIVVVVVENVFVVDILFECKKVGVNQVVGVNLFDVYCGKGVVEGYKSFVISLIFQDINCIFEEEEIVVIVVKCVEVLKE